VYPTILFQPQISHAESTIKLKGVTKAFIPGQGNSNRCADFMCGFWDLQCCV